MELVERTKREILSQTERWQNKLDLGHFAINHTFNLGQSENYAETSVLWEYLSADITWYLSKIAMPDIEWVVTHELTHILLAPMERHLKRGKDEQREFTVESVARLLRKL